MPKRKTRSDQEQEHEEQQPEILGGLNDPTLNSRQSGTEADADDSSIIHFTIPWSEKQIACERQQPPIKTDIKKENDQPPALIFTHGAGGGISNPATRDFATGFGTVDPIVTWQGTLNLPNRIKSFHAVVEHEKPKDDGVRVALGGRSMGARAAVLTALEMEDKPEALVLVSWPLTAGKEGKREPERREQILKDLPEDVDVLFVVGSEDVQCDLEAFEELRRELKARHWLVVVKGADHGMGLRAKEKDGVKPLRLKTGEIAAEWLRNRDDKRRYLEIGWNLEKGEVDSSGWQEVDDGKAKKAKRST